MEKRIKKTWKVSSSKSAQTKKEEQTSGCANSMFVCTHKSDRRCHLDSRQLACLSFRLTARCSHGVQHCVTRSHLLLQCCCTANGKFMFFQFFSGLVCPFWVGISVFLNSAPHICIDLLCGWFMIIKNLEYVGSARWDDTAAEVATFCLTWNTGLTWGKSRVNFGWKLRSPARRF